MSDTKHFDFSAIRTLRMKLANPSYHENTTEVCLVVSGRIQITIAVQNQTPGQKMAIRFRALQEHRFDILESAEILLIDH